MLAAVHGSPTASEERARRQNARLNQAHRYLHVQAIRIGNELTVFEIPPEYPEIQGPAVAGDAIMRIHAGRALVIEVDHRAAGDAF
jgi:hypothetical protein